MKKHLLILSLVCACIFLQGCTFNLSTVGAWRNKTIDEDLRGEIDVLNKKLFKAIMANNVKGVKAMMGEALLKQSGKTVDTLVNFYSDRFKAKDYRVLDQFYVKNSEDVTQELLRSDHEDDSNYQLEFVAINKKTYASVLVSTGLSINCMVLAIYGKYDDGWKLNMLEMGDYSVMDQTAPEYYQLAVSQYARGNYVDAGDMISIASQLAHPGGKFLYYQNEHEMKDTYSVIMEGFEKNYNFPLVITTVKTKPQIFHITPQVVTENELKGVFPMISYVTHIPIKDTVALKLENMALQSKIGEILQGVDKNKPCIVYRAFNRMPNDSIKTEYYQFFQRIKYGVHY